MTVSTHVEDPAVACGAVVLELADCDDVIVSLADLTPEEGEVRLDFRRMSSLSSAALSVLIRFCVRMRSLQKQVIVDHVSPEIQEIFQMTRFVRIATVRAQTSSAAPIPRRSLLFRRRAR